MSERPRNALDDIAGAFRHLHLGAVLLTLGFAALGVYFLTGFYTVKPGEQAVVRRFGGIVSTTGPGAHYRLPRPIDRVEIINVAEVRQAEIGLQLTEHKHEAFMPEKVQLLTGDENVINVEAIVHYTIKDAARYLYRVNFSEERLLHNAVAAALVELVGQIKVDDILTTEKTPAQTKVLWTAQKVLDEYESGLQISAFNIKAIVPPTEVADAFRDVMTAREDKEQSINQAKGYSNSLLPEARGKAREAVGEAEGYRTEVVNQAKGDAQRFEAMLAEYQRNSQIYSEDVTRYRLYLETMEKVFPRMSKYVVRATEGAAKVNLKFISKQ